MVFDEIGNGANLQAMFLGNTSRSGPGAMVPSFVHVISQITDEGVKPAMPAQIATRLGRYGPARISTPPS